MVFEKEIPDVRIYLVGANPSEKITRLADGQRIFIVTGKVPDIRPYIQKASICIAPLITGAGLRGKVIEYAALHRTFVATALATTDLAFEDGLTIIALIPPGNSPTELLPCSKMGKRQAKCLSQLSIPPGKIMTLTI